MSVVIPSRCYCALLFERNSMLSRYGVRKMEEREGKWCDVYEKHFFEIHIGQFNKWFFLSVVVIVGGAVFILSR